MNAAIVRSQEADGKPMTPAACNEFMRMLDPDWKYDRHGWYTHIKEHLTSPLITAAQKTKRDGPKILPKSNDEALEMIRDIGMQNVIDNPESIGVDHALRAISEQEKKSKGPENLWVLLSRVQSGEAPETLIGEFQDVTPQLETAQEAEVS